MEKFSITKQEIQNATSVADLQRTSLALLNRAEDLQLEVDSARNQMRAFQEMINKLMEEKERAQLNAKGNDEVASLKAMVDSLMAQKEEYELKVSAMKAELGEVKGKLESSEFEKESLDLVVASLKQQIQEMGAGDESENRLEQALQDKEDEIQVMLTAFEEDKQKWMEEIDGLKKQVESLKEENQELVNACDEDRRGFEEKIQGLNKQIEELKSERDLADSGNSEVEELKKRLLEMENESKRKGAEIDELKATVSSAEASVSDLTGKLSHREQMLEQLKKDFEKEKLEHVEENESKEVKVNQLMQKNDELEKSNAELSQQLIDERASNMSKELRAELASKETELSEAKAEVAKVQAEITELRQNNSDLMAKLQGHAMENDSLAKARETAAESVQRANDEISSLSNKVANLEAEKKSLQTKIEELDGERKTLLEDQKNIKSLLSETTTEKERVVGEYKASVEQLEKKVSKLQDLNDNLRAESQQKSQEFMATITKLEDQISGCTTLEKEVSDLKDKAAEGDRIRSKNQELELELSELRLSQQKQINILSVNLEEKTNRVAELEASVKQTTAENEQLTQKLSEQTTQLSQHMRQIKELQLQIDDQKFDALTTENRILNEKVQEMQGQLSEITHERDSLTQEKSQLEKTIAELEQANLSLENSEEVDKDATIARLRSLLERASKQDQIKQKKIDELKSAILEARSTQPNAAPEVHIDHMHAHVESDADKKIEKLNKMLETSSRLYAELSEEHQALKLKLQEATKPNRKPFTIIRQSCLSIEPSQTEAADVPRETAPQPHSPNPEAPSPEAPKPESENMLLNAYLKRTLLQFFLQDDSKRDAMIPMILELVGCNEQQITTAQRQWARSRQFFKTGIFGWGK